MLKHTYFFMRLLQEKNIIFRCVGRYNNKLFLSLMFTSPVYHEVERLLIIELRKTEFDNFGGGILRKTLVFHIKYRVIYRSSQ